MAAQEGSSPRGGGRGDPREVLTRAAPPPDAVLRYGAGEDQVADLRLPRADGEITRLARARSPSSAPGGAHAAPIIVFLHGGFWQTEFDRSHAGPLGAALAAAGYVVCMPEFRRASSHGSGWPGTFDDVAAAVDALPALVAAAVGSDRADSARVLLAGHSAGGHLALWAAGRHRLPPGAPWRTADRPPILAAVGLAAVSDLTACHEEHLGSGAAEALMGGPPDRLRDRYAAADPARLLPLGVPMWLVHGGGDDVVPPSMSRAFAARARAAGDTVVLRELPDCEHFGLIDPLSPAWPQVLGALDAAVRP